MNKFSQFSLGCFLAIGIAGSAAATNMNFMSNTAMSYFTEDDWSIFNATQQKVLNSGKANVAVEWKNAKSGSHGTMTPSAESRQNGMVCRKLTVVNFAHLIKGEGAYTFCKINNEWKIY
jgi:surface antigen